MAITVPGLVVSGQVIAASHLNGLRAAILGSYAEVYDWASNVDASGFNISAIGALGATSGTFTGALIAATITASGAVTAASATLFGALAAVTGTFSGAVTGASLTASGALTGATAVISGTQPYLRIFETGAALNEKLWFMLASVGALYFYAANDANTVANHWMQVNRTADAIDNVIFPSGNIGIGAAGAPSHRLCVTDVSRSWDGTAGGGGSFCVGSGPAVTDYGILMGYNTVSPGPYGWIQSIKPGTANYPLLINALGGQVVLRCSNSAVDDTFIPANCFSAWLDQSVNQLKFRVRRSDGVMLTGSVVLA